MIGFRHCDARFPFLWRAADQPPARWHGPGEGPVNYFADTPVGACAPPLRVLECVAHFQPQWPPAAPAAE